MIKTLAVPILALLLAPILAAQPSAKSNWGNLNRLTTGDEIRVTVPTRGQIRARFERATDEALIVNTPGKQESLDRASVASVAAKGERHRKRNALIGLGVGAGVGLGIGAGLDASQCHLNCFDILPNAGKEILTPLGALLGVTVGALLPTGGWREIYIQPIHVH
jgi:hypothetical protein